MRGVAQEVCLRLCFCLAGLLFFSGCVVGMRSLNNDWAAGRTQKMIGYHVPLPAIQENERAGLDIGQLFAEGGHPRSSGGSWVYENFVGVCKPLWIKQELGRTRTLYISGGLSFVEAGFSDGLTSDADQDLGGYIHVGYWTLFDMNPRFPVLLGFELRYLFGTEFTIMGERKSADGVVPMIFIFVPLGG